MAEQKKEATSKKTTTKKNTRKRKATGERKVRKGSFIRFQGDIYEVAAVRGEFLRTVSRTKFPKLIRIEYVELLSGRINRKEVKY